jgi:hypothetical protein
MTNPWIQHVKSYAKKNKLTYSCALSDPNCKSSYKRPVKGSGDLKSLQSQIDAAIMKGKNRKLKFRKK